MTSPCLSPDRRAARLRVPPSSPPENPNRLFTQTGRGFVALLPAPLLSDRFFVVPAFVFSSDRRVFRPSLVYLPGGLVSVPLSRRPAPSLA